MKSHNHKKLSLSTETLRTLSDPETSAAVGGGITSIGDVHIKISTSCWCHSGFCSIGAPCHIDGNPNQQ